MDDFLPRLGALLLFIFLAALGLACWPWARQPEAKATAAAFGVAGLVGMVVVMLRAVRWARRAPPPPEPDDEQEPTNAGR